MATIGYTFVSVCAGGGHVRIDVSLNGGAAKHGNFDLDQLRAPLSEISNEDRDLLAAMILRIHCAGMTRAQAAAELPLTVTI